MAQAERKDFLGRGWWMPVMLDWRTGRVREVEYEEDIRQSIRIIVETSQGERVMRPDFGCGIHDLVFSTVDSETVQRVRSTVEDALRHFEARIEVLDVNVLEDQSRTDGCLQIEVDYRVRLTNQLGNLVFPFYFREGGQR